MTSVNGSEVMASRQNETFYSQHQTPEIELEITPVVFGVFLRVLNQKKINKHSLPQFIPLDERVYLIIMKNK